MAANRVKIFVGNLPWTISKRELREYFSQFGHVSSANVVFDKETGMSRNFGFVRFSTRDGLIAATNRESHYIEGKIVTVQRSTDNNDQNIQ